MSSKQGNGKNCDDCGYDASNKRHEQSYWEDRRDPRDRDGIHSKILFYNSTVFINP